MIKATTSTPFEPRNSTPNSIPYLIEENANNGDFTSSLIANNAGTIEKIQISSGAIILLAKKKFKKNTNLFTLSSYDLKNNEKLPIVDSKKINSFIKIKTNDELLFGLRKDFIDVYNLKYETLIKTCKTELFDEIGNVIIKASKSHVIIANNKNIEIFDCLENENVNPISTLKCKGVFITFMKLIKNNLFVVSTKIINDKYKDVLETWDLENIDEIKHKRNFSFNKAGLSNNYIMNENILCKQSDNTFTLSNVDSGIRITPTGKNNDCHFVKVDGNRLFKGKKEIEIWNIEKFKRVTKSTLPQSHPEKIRVLRGHETWVHWIQVCGHLLVSGTQIEKNVRVWNIETGECVQVIDSPIDNIKLAFNRIILVVPSEESSNRGETNLERMSHSKHNQNQNIIIFDYNNSK